MNFKFFLNLKIVPFLILVFVGQASAQGCSFTDINCLSCAGYQICDTESPGHFAFACNYGRPCNAAELIRCWMKLKCYAPMSKNECTEAGLFPDLFYDFRYYVCLSDPSGFLKYEFVCPDGQFFDKIRLLCASRTADDSNDELSASSTTSDSFTTPSTLPTTLATTISTTPPIPVVTSSTSSTTPLTPSTTPSTPSTTPSTPSTTPSTPSTTPSTPSTTPSTPSTTPSTTPTPFVCLRPGIFADPINCKMYYRCSIFLKKIHYTCPNSSYFNDMILKCSMIITPQCQEQISKNATVVSLR